MTGDGVEGGQGSGVILFQSLLELLPVHVVFLLHCPHALPLLLLQDDQEVLQLGDRKCVPLPHKEGRMRCNVISLLSV